MFTDHNVPSGGPETDSNTLWTKKDEIDSFLLSVRQLVAHSQSCCVGSKRINCTDPRCVVEQPAGYSVTSWLTGEFSGRLRWLLDVTPVQCWLWSSDH